jgi:Methyltransferase domain
VTDYRELLIGAGHNLEKRIEPWHFAPELTAPAGPRAWRGKLETVDLNRRCSPTYVWDLGIVPWAHERTPDEPLPPSSYDEIHAYEVLEHFGRLGSYWDFFETFSEIWRLLKPNGFLCATCPSRYSEWLWGDPGHTRAILPASLVFLNQPQYEVQCGATSMSDYRSVYRADFDTLAAHDNRTTFMFVLRAIKPSRWRP